MKLEVSDMYGLNGKEKFFLDSNQKHNFIYGINASGKSSIASSIMHLINKNEYVKRFPYDSDDYSVKLEFNNLNIEYNKNVSLEKLPDISRTIFVFNKNFIKNSLTIKPIEGQGITPEIGIRVAEKSLLVEENNKIIDKSIKKIKKTLSDAKIPATQKELYNTSQFKYIYGKDINLQREALKKIDELKGIGIIELTSNDFINANIELFNNFNQNIIQLSTEIVSRLAEKIKLRKYKIDNKQIIDLYNETITYLNTQKGDIICPICLSTTINVENIKAEISETLRDIDNSDIMKDIQNIYNKLKRISSYFSELSIKIYDMLMNFEYPEELIKKFNEDLNLFLENYDYNILNYSNLKIEKEDIDKVNTNEKIIKQIDKSNEEIVNSIFIDEFDKMLDYVFKDDEIRAKSQLQDKTITIQLIIKGKEKEGKSIVDFFDIISESQKTKLSLAFYLSLITYKNEENDILCIFDDPIDSYDSISKYKISRVLYEFIEKKNLFESYQYSCSSIFLSHSIEYFRLFINNFRKSERKNIKYYIFSKGIASIDYNDLFIIEGDYKILEKLIHDDKDANKKIEEFLSILPILRELTDYSSKGLNTIDNELVVNNYSIKDISKYISNDIIHGFDCNVTLKDLLDELRKVIIIELEPHIYSDDTKIFDIIENIIIQNESKALERKISFREEIVLKNLIALYIRAFYDSILIKILKHSVKKYEDKTIEEIKNDNELWTINNKINAIYKEPLARQNYKSICVSISVNLTMLNDFAHSAGIYMTPLVDVDIEDLYKLYKEIKNENSIYKPIKELAYN